MTLVEIEVGDVVRVDGESKPWRVEAKDTKTGLLKLEALNTIFRQTWSGVHEFRVEKTGVFA